MDDADRLPQQLQSAGLYDPAAPDAPERLELLRFNLAQGLTVEELVEAERLGRQEYVAGDPHLRPAGERLTIAQLAERADIELPLLQRFWRAAGIAEPARDELAAYESDINVVRFIYSIIPLYGEDVMMRLVRTFGAALSRLAEAELGAFTTTIAADLMQSGRSVELAQTNVGISQLIPQVTRFMDVLHRHHLMTTMLSFFADPTTRESQTKPLAVGFADLVGYTAFAASADSQQVAMLVEEFEGRARDTVTEHGGRVVKMIGDEVMFVAGDAATACRIAAALTNEARALTELPDIRIGLACGDVLTGYGDYYGPVVNLASRLVSISATGVVLVDAEVRRRAHVTQPDLIFREAGRRLLKGFPEPVHTFELALSAGDPTTVP